MGAASTECTGLSVRGYALDHRWRMHLLTGLRLRRRLLLGIVPAVLALGAVQPLGLGSVAPPVVRTVTQSASDSSANGDSSANWAWPLSPRSEVIRGFVAPSTRYAAGHRGIDLRTSASQEVRAPSAGVVSFAGSVAGRPVVSLAHPGDLISSFEPVFPAVSVEDSVAEGTIIGTMASGGHCEAVCLHIGVRLHGQYVSPLLYLAGDVPRAILLPLARPRR